MICVDTTFLIDLLKGREEAVKLAEELDEEPAVYTTVINVFEVIAGVFANKSVNKQMEYEKAMQLFRTLKILPLDHDAALEAGKIAGELMSTGNQIDNNDCMTVGIAKTNGINTIVTRNEKHFKATGIAVKSY